ncbi:MAG: tetratricopeptide repeat protein [Bacteroidetes bacterium]|nr:tetratricopeptide repeat protein [Bacteroidota bacterium]
MRLVRAIAFVWILGCGISVVHAQPDSYAAYRQQIELQLLDFQYDAAGQLTRFYLADGDIPRFYQNHSLFLKAFIWQKGSDMDAFLADASLQDSYFAQHKVEDPLNRVFHAEIILKIAIIQVLQGNHLKAAYSLQSAWAILQKQVKKYPDHPQNDRLLGIFHLAFSGVPSEYKWVLGIFGMEGDFNTGIRLLERAAREAPYLNLETQLVLYYAERNLKAGIGDASHRIDSLHTAHPDILAVSYLYIHNLLDKGSHAVALAELQRVSARAAQMPYIHYQLGKACYYTEQFDEAIVHFQNYVYTYPGKLFVADALFKRALSYALSGNRVKARAAFHEMANSYAYRTSQFDEDQYAQAQATWYQNKLFTDVEQQLLYMRYQTDGGRPQEALKKAQPLLATAPMLSNDERTELYYRLGRAYHLLGRWDEAKTSYRNAIVQNPIRALWMKVYAHFYIAQIMEQQAEWHDARRYYKEALQYSSYPFQKSLEQKTKAGLSRLKHKRYDLPEGN